MQSLKLIVIGPSGSGKTTISNCLADATEIQHDYRATRGVRILEFEVVNVNVKNRHANVDVELWDCSGDLKYENCWPALRNNAQGVIFVVSEKVKDSARHLEKFYDYFVSQTSLGPKDCVLLYYSPNDKGFFDASKFLPPSFAKLSRVKCNVEDGGVKLRSDFRTYVSSLMIKLQEFTDEEEKLLMNDNVLFTK